MFATTNDYNTNNVAAHIVLHKKSPLVLNQHKGCWFLAFGLVDVPIEKIGHQTIITVSHVGDGLDELLANIFLFHFRTPFLSCT